MDPVTIRAARPEDGRTFAANAASRALARAAGFREIGLERRHARLDGEWRDCVPVERLLGEAEG
jgi:RimJ/RimL family protein N-acetyltransferase